MAILHVGHTIIFKSVRYIHIHRPRSSYSLSPWEHGNQFTVGSFLFLFSVFVKSQTICFTKESLTWPNNQSDVIKLFIIDVENIFFCRHFWDFDQFPKKEKQTTTHCFCCFPSIYLCIWSTYHIDDLSYPLCG